MVAATAAPPVSTVTPDPAALVAKLNTLANITNGIVLECTTEVRCAVVAMLAGRHVCMIGLPGVAKSMLARTLFGQIGGLSQGDYFETCLGKMDTPGKLLGPISLRALDLDQEIRTTKGRLPVARFAFIDEIWEGSSALLEYLLPILQERLFHNDGTPTPVPLVTALMASNKTPERNSELAALWDRITFRLFTRGIQNDDNFVLMLRMAEARYSRLGFANQETFEPTITWDELVMAQDAVRTTPISDDVYEGLLSLRAALKRKGIEPSERRFAQSLPIVKAQAFLAGRSVAGIDDMRLLSHVLWNTQDEQPIVQRLVLELANPDDKVAMDISDSVEVLAKELNDLLAQSDNTQVRSRKAVELQGKLENASDDVKKLRAKMRREGRTSDIIDPLRGRVLSLSATLLRECFTIPDDDLDDDDE